jgi:hypothetical protein
LDGGFGEGGDGTGALAEALGAGSRITVGIGAGTEATAPGEEVVAGGSDAEVAGDSFCSRENAKTPTRSSNPTTAPSNGRGLRFTGSTTGSVCFPGVWVLAQDRCVVTL